MRLLKWIKWRIKGRPKITYSGFNCGCCGNWVTESFQIPEYKSVGEWEDTWGVCEECGNYCQDFGNKIKSWPDV